MDFPLPVRPTIPTFYLGLMEKLTFLITVCRFELYLSETSLKTILPLVKICIENGDYNYFYDTIYSVYFSLSMAVNASH